MILFFDVETTGLPNFKRPADWEGQPRLVQYAGLLTDDAGKIVQAAVFRVRPDFWVVTGETTKIHGLTTEILHETGIPIGDIMHVVASWMSMAARRVGHNIAFDNKIIRGELRRAGLPDQYDKSKDFCTAHGSRKLVAAQTPKQKEEGRPGTKMPKLSEAFNWATGRELENAHEALADVHACKAVYFALVNYGAVPPINGEGAAPGPPAVAPAVVVDEDMGAI